jgi:hypothetical protein
MNTIRYWIENEVEPLDNLNEMPEPHQRPISYIKIPLLWSLHHLKQNTPYEEAIRCMMSKGGDTKSNAAIVGAMAAAVHGVGIINI